MLEHQRIKLAVQPVKHCHHFLRRQRGGDVCEGDNVAEENCHHVEVLRLHASPGGELLSDGGREHFVQERALAGVPRTRLHQRARYRGGAVAHSGALQLFRHNAHAGPLRRRLGPAALHELNEHFGHRRPDGWPPQRLPGAALSHLSKHARAVQASVRVASAEHLGERNAEGVHVGGCGGAALAPQQLRSHPQRGAGLAS